MADLGSLVASLGLDIRDFEKKINTIEKELKDTSNTIEKQNKKIESSFKSINTVLKGVIGTYLTFKTIQKTAGLVKDVSLASARYTTLGVILQNVGKNANYSGGGENDKDS